MESSSSSSLNDDLPESKSVESIIDSLPITSFHHVLLIICSLSFMTDAIEVNLLSYISPCAGADFNLSEQEQATVVSVVFAGQLIGSLFWGPFADHFGRRTAFFYAALIITLFSFASAFSTNYIMLLLFRGIVGFGVGGCAVPFDILAEFIPTKFRGKYLMYIQYFWTFGSLLIIGIAWGLLSTQGWRVVTFLGAVPVGVCCLLCYVLLPESPRWLVVKGRYDEAESVLKLAAKKCGITLRPFRLQSEDVGNIIPQQASLGLSCTKLCNFSEYYELIRTQKARRISLPLWVIWIIFGFTYYGIILFVNQIYSTSKSSSDSSSSSGCSFDFQFIFYSSLSEIVATAIVVPCIDRLGRIRTQIVFYLLSGIAVILMSMPFSFYTVFVIGLIGRISISGASVSDCINVYY
jgi:MFS family permease